MTLLDRQIEFNRALAGYLAWLEEECRARGMAHVLGRLHCCPSCSKDRSLHRIKLAVDFALFRRTDTGWALCTTTPDYEFAGVEWERRGGSWGGRFGDNPVTAAVEGWDGNHLSFAWLGMR